LSETDSSKRHPKRLYNTGKATDPPVGTSFTESTNASDATDPIAASSNGRQHTDDKTVNVRQFSTCVLAFNTQKKNKRSTLDKSDY